MDEDGIIKLSPTQMAAAITMTNKKHIATAHAESLEGKQTNEG